MASAIGAMIAGVSLGNDVFAQKSAKALDDRNISHGLINFDNDGERIEGFLARPKRAGRFRAVIVTHGNAALPEDIRNTAAQLAQAGFVAPAVNPTSRYPDTSKFPRFQSGLGRIVKAGFLGIKYKFEIILRGKI